MPHHPPEQLPAPDHHPPRPRVCRIEGPASERPQRPGRRLRSVEFGPPHETQERWVASLRWSLAGVPPTYRQSYVSWTEALDVWSDWDPRLVFQLHMELGAGEIGAAAFEIHAYGASPRDAETLAVETESRLASVWRGLGAAWKWQQTSCAAPFDGTQGVELAEIFAAEERVDDDWTFRPVRFQPGAVMERLATLGHSQQRLHYAVSFRPVLATAAEVDAPGRCRRLAVFAEPSRL